MNHPPATPTITSTDIHTAMTADRPDLLDTWVETSTETVELGRVAANAQWLWERHLAASSDWTSTLQETGQLRDYAISQAIWLATPDDLDEQNTFDRDPDDEPLSATSLRSGWFST